MPYKCRAYLFMGKYFIMPDANKFKPVFTMERLTELVSKLLKEESGHIRLTECIEYSGDLYELFFYYGENRTINLGYDLILNGVRRDNYADASIYDYKKRFLERAYNVLLDEKYI